MHTQLRYRPVENADEKFLLRLYASTRAAELALTGWDTPACEAFVLMQFKAQTAFYEQQWPDAEHSIIQVLQGTTQHDAGRLWLHQRDSSLHVLDIALLPAWCGRGMGGACLQGLQSRAAGHGLNLSVQVEQGNPARRLYERLGFVPVGAQQGIHQYMRWRHDPVLAASLQTEALSEQT